MHRETSKFKQSIPTLVSPVSSTGIRDNNIIYITPIMILYEDLKPIEHFLVHPICVFSYMMCAWKHSNIKISLYYCTLWSCWWICLFKISRWYFIIKLRHLSPLKQANLVEKKRSGRPAGHMRKNATVTVTWSERLKIYCRVIVTQWKSTVNQSARKFRNLFVQAKERTWANCSLIIAWHQNSEPSSCAVRAGIIGRGARGNFYWRALMT